MFPCRQNQVTCPFGRAARGSGSGRVSSGSAVLSKWVHTALYCTCSVSRGAGRATWCHQMACLRLLLLRITFIRVGIYEVLRVLYSTCCPACQHQHQPQHQAQTILRVDIERSGTARAISPIVPTDDTFLRFSTPRPTCLARTAGTVIDPSKGSSAWLSSHASFSYLHYLSSHVPL